MTEKKRKCQLATQLCSGSLIARYQGKKKGDPVFDACGACMVYLKLRRSVRQVSVETPLTS